MASHEIDPYEHPGPYRAIPCPCGDRACTSWMVDPVAAVQGVSFTQAQAELVADTLNERAKELASCSTP